MDKTEEGEEEMSIEAIHQANRNIFIYLNLP